MVLGVICRSTVKFHCADCGSRQFGSLASSRLPPPYVIDELVGAVCGNWNCGVLLAMEFTLVIKSEVGLPALFQDMGPRVVMVKIPKPARMTVLLSLNG